MKLDTIGDGLHPCCGGCDVLLITTLIYIINERKRERETIPEWLNC